MKYLVTLDFKRGPSFSVELLADSDKAAIAKATAQASMCGFCESVKKAKAIQK